MRYCIIGGAGFIGSHLISILLKMGNTQQIIIIDNFSTGLEKNIKKFYKEGEVQFIIDDILSMDEVELIDAIDNSDIVFNFAGSVGVKYIENNPRKSIINNLKSMMRILDCMKGTKKLLVYTSTSEVYGDQNQDLNEKSNLSIGNPDHLRWGYASSKIVNEFLAKSYNFPVIIVRPFNIIGPNQISKYGMVVPTFIENALNNDPIIINGTGEQSRCFCYISDFLVALLKITFNRKCYNQIYNIGNPNNLTSIKKLADTIKFLTLSKSEIICTETSDNTTDINYRVPDITKISTSVKWQPKMRLKEALSLIISEKRKTNESSINNNDRG